MPGQIATKLPWFTRNTAHDEERYKREQNEQDESQPRGIARLRLHPMDLRTERYEGKHILMLVADVLSNAIS